MRPDLLLRRDCGDSSSLGRFTFSRRCRCVMPLSMVDDRTDAFPQCFQVLLPHLRRVNGGFFGLWAAPSGKHRAKSEVSEARSRYNFGPDQVNFFLGCQCCRLQNACWGRRVAVFEGLEKVLLTFRSGISCCLTVTD
jgi:hypothetical protein